MITLIYSLHAFHTHLQFHFKYMYYIYIFIYLFFICFFSFSAFTNRTHTGDIFFLLFFVFLIFHLQMHTQICPITINSIEVTFAQTHHIDHKIVQKNVNEKPKRFIRFIRYVCIYNFCENFFFRLEICSYADFLSLYC